jgi:hypothetical protein
MRTMMLVAIFALFGAVNGVCDTKAAMQGKEPVLKQTSTVMKKQDLTKPPREMKQWSLFQIGFLPKWPSFTKISNVYGLKLGAPMCSGYGRVFGIEPSILYSGTRHVWGVQGSFWGTCLAQEIRGVQASSFGPSLTMKLLGLQAVGSLGMADTVYGAQIAPVTICRESVTGFQFGAVNIAKPVTGFQGGAVNIAEDVTGFQLGIFNYAKRRGLQFGLVNIIKGGWLPFTLIVNYSNADEEVEER